MVLIMIKHLQMNKNLALNNQKAIKDWPLNKPNQVFFLRGSYIITEEMQLTYFRPS